MNQLNNAQRNIALVLEVERAIKYLKLGLAELQKINAANDFYDPVFIYLSGGLERLFKTFLCLNYRLENGCLPNDFKLLWGQHQGHNINYLKTEFEKKCEPIERLFGANDWSVMTEDVVINRICSALSGYGQRARYFNLDIILGNQQHFDSKKEWELIETFVLKNHYGKAEYLKRTVNAEFLEESYKTCSRELTAKLELFFRAITRQFLFGKIKDEASRYIFSFSYFSQMDDNQIGQTNYQTISN